MPSSGVEERVGDARQRADAAGWDQAVVLDDRRVLLGWLSREALRSDPTADVAAAMLEGPVTFRPNLDIAETASWIDVKAAGSVLVTSSDGTFIGVVWRLDLNVTERGTAEA